MRAALITELGEPPAVGEADEPAAGDGEVIVETAAASFNPVDVAVAGGSFYAGHPDLPYVPAIEATGTAPDGRTVFVVGGGLGVVRNGTAAERFTAPASALIELPPAADPVMAAALGTAALAGWLPLSWRAPVQPGETVLVLGATGTAGTVAVQAARALGAGRVVAAGRSPERLAAIADLVDAAVDLGADEPAERFQEACGDGADVIYDVLWGEPLVAALAAAKVGARVVHVGQSAGPVAAIPSAAVRGKQLSILGYSNFAVPAAVLTDAYLTMVNRAIAGELRLDVTAVPLEDVVAAWRGVASGSGKFVVVP